MSAHPRHYRNPECCPKPYNPIYGVDAPRKKHSAESSLEAREKASAIIAQLLANSDMALPSEEPFIPKGTAVERTVDEHKQHKAICAIGKIGEEVLKAILHKEDLARKIALDAEFMGVIAKTGLIEILNAIIGVNNAFWSDSSMQEEERMRNYGVNAAYTMLQKGKMPHFEESDVALMKEGRMNELSREGKVARVIYAKLLAKIFIQSQKGLTTGETHRYQGVRSQTARLSYGATMQPLHDDLLALPHTIHFGRDGINRLEWGNRIEAFLKTHEVQLDTRKEIADIITP